jgi:hypothetical protein
MNKKEIFKLLNEAYWKIKNVLECVGHGSYHSQYYALNLKEEKEHRQFYPWGYLPCGLTTGEAVKLFYVQEIVEALFMPSFIPTVKDYLSIRQSIFFAHSLAVNYKEELSKALQGINWLDIIEIDYAELMK